MICKKTNSWLVNLLKGVPSICWLLISAVIASRMLRLHHSLNDLEKQQ